MKPDLGRYRDAAREGVTRVPLVREVVLDGDTPVSAYAKLHRGEYGLILESLEGGERWARYSFLATEPSAVYRYFGRAVERYAGGKGWVAEADAVPLEHLALLMRAERALVVPGLPRFTGGAIGFWGYDVARSLEAIGEGPADDRQLPDAIVMVVDRVLVLDNLFHRAMVISNVHVSTDLDDTELAERVNRAERGCTDWLERLAQPNPLLPLAIPVEFRPAHATSRMDQAAYERGVMKCQEHIAAGNAFQIVLSRRLDVESAPDPFATYRWLRALNPAPYCYLLHCGSLAIAGASPEVLVRVEDGEVTVRPIAGTRPRGRDPAHDATLEAELRADPKELAEHVMLVDLGRNDVGRVARYGSISLPARLTIERYSQVMHLVSEVRGTLRDGLDAVDALVAAFPAGTVSGAPKVRAMQIIDELEVTRRGPYAGAVGYLGWGATALDTAIAIRTVVFHDGQADVQAGAGIVADSVPRDEWAESEAKARAPLIALECARGGGRGGGND